MNMLKHYLYKNQHIKANLPLKQKKKTDTKAFILFYGDVTINTSLRHHDWMQGQQLAS